MRSFLAKRTEKRLGAITALSVFGYDNERGEYRYEFGDASYWVEKQDNDEEDSTA
jgi:hypothetical protein